LADNKDNGRRLSCLFSNHTDFVANCSNHIDLAPNQVGGQLGQSVDFVFRPAIDNRNIFTFDIAGLLQSLAKRAQPFTDSVR
jgi:hypothetical protein